MISPIYRFIKGSFKELNPWHNIKLFHTNVRGDILAGITLDGKTKFVMPSLKGEAREPSWSPLID